MEINDLFSNNEGIQEEWRFEVVYCEQKRACGNWIDASELPVAVRDELRWLRDNELSLILCPQCKKQKMRYYRAAHLVRRFPGFLATSLMPSCQPDFNLIHDRYWGECWREGAPFVLLAANGREYAIYYDLIPARNKFFDPGEASLRRRWYSEVFQPFAAKREFWKAFSPARGVMFCRPPRAYTAAAAIISFWKSLELPEPKSAQSGMIKRCLVC